MIHTVEGWLKCVDHDGGSLAVEAVTRWLVVFSWPRMYEWWSETLMRGGGDFVRFFFSISIEKRESQNNMKNNERP